MTFLNQKGTGLWNDTKIGIIYHFGIRNVLYRLTVKIITHLTDLSSNIHVS